LKELGLRDPVLRRLMEQRGARLELTAATRSRTRRSSSRAAALLRLAATTVGRSDTALGALYRRLSSRAGKSKAVTATARKIAVLFSNTLRHGMSYRDPGADHYEQEYASQPRHRQPSVGGPSRWASFRLYLRVPRLFQDLALARPGRFRQLIDKGPVAHS